MTEGLRRRDLSLMIYFEPILHWLVHSAVAQVLRRSFEYKLGAQLVVQLLRRMFTTWIRSIIVKIIT